MGTAIIAILLFSAVIWAIRKIIYNRRSGKGCCSCGHSCGGRCCSSAAWNKRRNTAGTSDQRAKEKSGGK